MHRVWMGFSAVALALSAVPAHALLLTPGDADFSDYQQGNCEPGCVNSYFGTSFSAGNLLYKSEDGKPGVAPLEEGSFLSYYTTTFFPQGDAEDATIAWDGPLSIVCDACYLAVKDGKADPNYYFFDLGALLWNGTDSIVLNDFWPSPGKGAISHVSIWGKSSVSVPEPGTLSLLGAGLLAAGLLGRRRRKTLAA